ncbi:MFS transporter [Schlegelella sp. S2-27]|uniref:MFS transporter n=1 Tax=Caldimonas mangrovi TaxID=2944811 RepID=A0ABT0YK95_9BURK|nr:MFS transporter [Caldimonas mangrovi]MCM5678632.1 MFS transporter [Caldimonas mangrovi]
MSPAVSRRPVLALAAICLAALMFGLEISSVPVVLPVLKARLGAGFQDLQWIMNAYTIACTTVLMVTGTLADRYGRRRVFMLSVLAFGVASLLCGLAPCTPVLIGARFLQGMAGGAMFICSIATLSHEFPEGRVRGRAFAVWGVVAGIGLGFGPVVGSTIAALLSWHWVFLVHAPLALLGLAWIRAGIAESRDPQAGQQRLDLAGLVTLTLAVLGFTSLITQGDSLGWSGPIALGLGALSAVSLVAFVVVERRHPHPMFDFSVFRIRDFSGAILGCVGMNCSYWPFMIYLPLYFSAGLDYDTATAGLALLVYTVPFLVMPPIAQWLLLRYQARFVIPAGLFLIGLGFVLMKLGSGIVHTVGGWAVLPGALTAGVGLGLTTTPATNMTTGSVPARRAGMASGMDVSARLITLALNIAVMGAVLVTGTAAALRAKLGPAPEQGLLRAVAEQLAGGDVPGAQQALAALGQREGAALLLQEAVAQGFGWVMLYAALGAWLSAALSLMVFGGPRVKAARSVSSGVAGRR